MRKKILLILYFILLLFYIFTNKIFAGNCDPTKYNESAAYTNTTGCNPNDCLNETHKGRYPGTTEYVCWHAGNTTTKPKTCPSGYKYSSLYNKCCDQNLPPSRQAECQTGGLDPACADETWQLRGSGPYAICVKISLMPGKGLPIKLLSPELCWYTSPNSPVVLKPGTEWTGLQTALGCFPTDAKEIVIWILKYGIIFGGGVGFLLMLYGAFLVIISTGDPEKLKNGWGILFSALTGLVIIIFALFILRLIGFTILRIPGFG